MIDINKYEGHTKEEWQFDGETVFYHRNGKDVEITQPIIRGDCDDGYYEDAANAFLIEDAPLLLEFVQKVVEKWVEPNQCNQGFGEDVRQLMYEYGLITFNEETRRYEVKE